MKFAKPQEKQFVNSLKFSKKRIIGAEVELVAIKKDGRSISWEQAKNLFKELAKIKGWEGFRDMKSGPIIGVKSTTTKHGWHDIIMNDTGIGLIEIAMAPEYDLHKIRKRYLKIKNQLIDAGEKLGIKFLGYGIQPISVPSPNLVTQRKRYLIFSRNKLKLRKKKSGAKMYSTVIAANQTNINLKNKTEAIEALNTLLALVPVQIALFSNSSVNEGKIDEYKARRGAFWYGSNKPWHYGMPSRPFSDLEDYFRAIWSLQTFMVKRDSELYMFEEYIPFAKFLEFGGDGTSYTGRQLLKIQPTRADVEFHNGFVWWDARIKTPEKTTYLEIRPCATQPPGEQMTVFAFHLGIVENLKAVQKVLAKISWKDLLDARHMVIVDGFKAKIKDIPVAELAEKILLCAQIGLKKRKLGEEIYLEPLFNRTKTKKSPADRAILLFKQGGIKKLIKEYTLVKDKI